MWALGAEGASSATGRVRFCFIFPHSILRPLQLKEPRRLLFWRHVMKNVTKTVQTFSLVLVLIVSSAGLAAGGAGAQKVQASGPTASLFEFNR